jgi:methylmalonyl-CoA mutase C-terminal domain/subunit
MRRPRILLAKTGLDGHWRGLTVVARSLRDAGFEIVMLGMARAEQIVQAAIEEDIDLVGLNVGGQVEGVERILDALREAGADVPVVAGGTLSPDACRRLGARGVRTFPPGSGLQRIVETARELTRSQLP